MMHPYLYKCEVLRVVGGDTLDLMVDAGFCIYLKERVRLAYIDAPEQRTRDLEEKERGIAATKFLEDLIRHGQEAGKQFYLDSREFDASGKYGRTIGVLKIENASINQIMLDEGHAVPYEG